jgi:hypothetical protein
MGLGFNSLREFLTEVKPLAMSSAWLLSSNAAAAGTKKRFRFWSSLGVAATAPPLAHCLAPRAGLDHAAEQQMRHRLAFSGQQGG